MDSKVENEIISMNIKLSQSEIRNWVKMEASKRSDVSDSRKEGIKQVVEYCNFEIRRIDGIRFSCKAKYVS